MDSLCLDRYAGKDLSQETIGFIIDKTLAQKGMGMAFYRTVHLSQAQSTSFEDRLKVQTEESFGDSSKQVLAAYFAGNERPENAEALLPVFIKYALDLKKQGEILLDAFFTADMPAREGRLPWNLLWLKFEPEGIDGKSILENGLDSAVAYTQTLEGGVLNEFYIVKNPLGFTYRIEEPVAGHLPRHKDAAPPELAMTRRH